jgi:hypothetical protein
LVDVLRLARRDGHAGSCLFDRSRRFASLEQQRLSRLSIPWLDWEFAVVA